MDDSGLTPKSPNGPADNEMVCESAKQHSADHGADSGYSSLSATPATDGSSEKSSGRFTDFPPDGDGAETCTRRRLFSLRPDLSCFEKPLEDSTLRWFQATAPLIEQLLVEFLKAGRRSLSPKFKPIAVRLMVLGRSEASARPHLVVFSPPKGSKKIEKFFARDEIKDLLVPGDGSDAVTVVVAAHTTGFLMCLISDIKAFCAADGDPRHPRHTLCGLPIMVNSRRMTLGGIIRVLVFVGDEKSEWKLYGLSAGHFQGNLGEGDEDDSELDDSDDERGPEAGAHISSALGSPFAPKTAPWDWHARMTLGNIAAFDDTRSPTSPDLDWSLIHLNCLLPNLLDSTSTDRRDGGYRRPDLVAPQSTVSSNLAFSNASHRNVVVASGTRGLQRGKLYCNPTRVMLGRSETFSNTYILRLESGTVGPGDSGSWVVDPSTFEVLGHVVAKDMLGDAYVIPFTDVLNDIKSRLGCIDVGLPSTLHILSEAMALGRLYEAASSPPGTPKTPIRDDLPVDSGYNTNTFCSPDLGLELKKPLASGPHHAHTDPEEQGNSSSSASSENPSADRAKKRRRLDAEFVDPPNSCKALFQHNRHNGLPDLGERRHSDLEERRLSDLFPVIIDE